MKEPSKCLGGMKSVMKNRTLGMAAKRRLYVGVVVLIAETWNMREADRRRLDVLGLSRMERLKNEDVRQRTKVESCFKEWLRRR